MKSVAILIIVVLFPGLLSGNHALEPIPRTIKYDRQKAELGKRLFFDPGLSSDGTVSCASCHNTENGADSRSHSVGIKGKTGHINAPTVFNSVFNFRQMWNGRAESLQDQVRMPVHNPVEMAMDQAKITRYLRSNPFYSSQFEKIYQRPANFADMSDATAEFEKALITPDSRFDRYLRGEITLGAEEMKGYELFKRLGCITCHNGINLGGNSFQKIGLINAYPWKKENPDRFSLTKKEQDKNVYKVPTLRNIALTAPYFHDGSVATLREALKKMAYHNLGFDLTDQEIDALIAFLKTLTGKKPAILQEGSP